MADWQDIRNLLCVRLDALGDVLMTEPALRALRQTFPAARLTLLTSPSGAEAARLLPCIDAVITHRAPWMKHDHPDPHDRAFVDALRARAFDAAVIFTVYSQNPLPAAMMCHFADIPRRLAFCRENPYSLLTDWLPEDEPARLMRHEVTRQLALVAAIGAATLDTHLRITIPRAARARATQLWSGFGARKRIVIHPGASAPSRRYPAERFAAAAAQIAGQCDAAFVITGSADEAALVDRVAAQAPLDTLTLADQLAVDEWAALIAEADLLISNNTASVHLAAATDTPVVDLYALTNPQHTPWRVPAVVLSHPVSCRNCHKSVCPQGHHQCLLGIETEAVADAALQLLGIQRDRPASAAFRAAHRA